MDKNTLKTIVYSKSRYFIICVALIKVLLFSKVAIYANLVIYFWIQSTIHVLQNISETKISTDIESDKNEDDHTEEDNYMKMIENKPRTTTQVKKFKKPQFKLDK